MLCWSSDTQKDICFTLLEKPAVSGIYLPPSCQHACELAAALAPSSLSLCCRWCHPSLVHLDNCGHKLTVQNGLPTSQECIFRRTKEMPEREKIQPHKSKQILAILTMKRQNQKIKVYITKIYTKRAPNLKMKCFSINLKANCFKNSNLLAKVYINK